MTVEVTGGTAVPDAISSVDSLPMAAAAVVAPGGVDQWAPIENL
jgi:hypothetical protein